MTNRDFFTAVISANLSNEMNTKAQEMIDALDRKNDKRKATGTKTQQANAEIKVNILTAIKNREIETIDGYVTAKTVATKFDITTQKASPLLKQLVEANELEENSEIKSKTGKVRGYKIPETKTTKEVNSQNGKMVASAIVGKELK